MELITNIEGSSSRRERITGADEWVVTGSEAFCRKGDSDASGGEENEMGG